MPTTAYRRVSLTRLESDQTGTPADPCAAAGSWRRWLLLVMPVAVLLCVVQSVIVVVAGNLYATHMSSNLISVIGFVALLLLVLVANPLIRLGLRDRLRPFSRAELVTLFAVVLVSSGVGSFGLASQLIPIVHAPWNPEWNVAQRGWSEDLLPYMHPDLYLSDPDQIRIVREGVGVARPPDSAALTEKVSYWAQVTGAIPWSVWFGPLSVWLAFVVACYGMFYFLSHVVLGYWSQREKLIFPLAQLPEALLPESDGDRRLWPPLFRSGLFWFGFLVAAGVTAWNAAITAEWITGGLTRIPFGIAGSEIAAMLEGTPLEGVSLYRGGILMFVYSFVGIGIAFLLPTQVSFSVCFYYLVGVAIIVIGSWMNHTKIQSDWLWHNHVPSALGAGGLLCFSAVSLWRCVAAYRHLGRGRSAWGRLRLAGPVVGLLVSMLLMTLWLRRYAVNPASGLELGFFWALLFVAVTTLVTLGLMRLVAEGGIYWFQSHVSFFHLHRMLGMGKLLKPVLIGPLLPIYSVLFLDIKTFMAPNLLNAAKMREDVGGSRARFHATVLIGIAVSIVVTLGLTIFLCYLEGGTELGGWFFSAGPQRIMDTARSAVRDVPEFHLPKVAWYVVGAVWLALSLLLRQVLFWFPHPIGFIMLINPLIAYTWGSFLIAWVCKTLVVRYGGKVTYLTVRAFFLGLIVGELVSVAVWPTLGMLLDFNTAGIDLNRSGP